MTTDLAFGAHAVAGVNPDVLGDDAALLVEFEVFLELRKSVEAHTVDCEYPTHICGIGDDGGLRLFGVVSSLQLQR